MLKIILLLASVVFLTRSRDKSIKPEKVKITTDMTKNSTIYKRVVETSHQVLH